MTKRALLRALLLAASLAAALSASAQNLVKDPGFEASVGAANATTPYAAGQSFDGGSWLVGNPPSGAFGFFDVDKLSGFVIGGDASVYFQGSSLQQTLATTPGTAYAVSFDVYGYSVNGTPFSVGFGSTTATPTASLGSAGAGHFSFVATAGAVSTLLRFDAPTTGSLELDNVSVTPQAVPEPSALAALALGAAGLLRRRKRA